MMTNKFFLRIARYKRWIPKFKGHMIEDFFGKGKLYETWTYKDHETFETKVSKKNLDSFTKGVEDIINEIKIDKCS